MPSRSSKEKLIDVRELGWDRTYRGNLGVSPRKIEFRDNAAGDLVLTGYASTFDEYEVYGGPENYGWIEKIDRGAFTLTLSQSPDLHLLINHDGMPLARTKSKNLVLSVDDVGLKVVATLDKSDPDVQSLIPKMARGDMDEMSFAFRVKHNEWSAADGFEDDPMSYRLITELSLQKGDVSVVNFGANPHTSVGLQTVGAAVSALAAADFNELRAAGKGIDPREIRSAIRQLTKLTAKPDGVGSGIDIAVRSIDVMIDKMIEERATTDDMIQGLHDWATDMGADCDGEDDDDENDDGDDEDSDEELSAGGKATPVTKRQPTVKPDVKPVRRSTIADGLRIEVGGTAEAPVVRLHDGSGQLDEGIRAVLANEVREAVIGNRGAISKATPATEVGDTISLSDAAHVAGRNERVEKLKADLGMDTRRTFSLADAKAVTGK